jgi:5'-3' exonuclease
MSTNGAQMGGAVGFVKTMRGIIDLLQPKRVIVAWEGGGSARRRALYSEYKQNRRPLKLNRFYGDDLPDSDENRIEQNLILVKLLQELPVNQIYVEDAEGDDVIAYLCRNRLRDDKKIIVSADRDYYQLLDDTTSIYTPDRKWVSRPEVVRRFGVSATNFAVAKAICGDPSDNVPGVEGVGFKRLSKKFPMLIEEAEHLLDEVLAFAEQNRDASSIYAKVADAAVEIRRNYRLIALDTGMLAANQVAKVDYAFDTFHPQINRLRFTQRVIEYGLNASLDIDSIVFAFRGFLMVQKREAAMANSHDSKETNEQ